MGQGPEKGRSLARLQRFTAEFKARMHKGALPHMLAAFPNLAISILRLLGRPNLRRAIHRFRMRPREALAVQLGTKPPRAL